MSDNLESMKASGGILAADRQSTSSTLLRAALFVAALFAVYFSPHIGFLLAASGFDEVADGVYFSSQVVFPLAYSTAGEAGRPSSAVVVSVAIWLAALLLWLRLGHRCSNRVAFLLGIAVFVLVVGLCHVAMAVLGWSFRLEGP